MQTLETDLLKEFKEELSKARKIQAAAPTIINLQSPALAEFWNKFLSEPFPEGKINGTLEKNFAIFIIKNNLPIEQITERYRSQNWHIDGLLGWIKKAQQGDLVGFNIKELLQWSNENEGFCVEILEQAKKELGVQNDLLLTAQDVKILSAREIRDYQEMPYSWRVDRIIGVAKICILAGKRSTLKSWMALDMALAVVDGKPFLDKFGTEKSSVLYIDREMGFDEIKKRLTIKGKNFPENLFFLSESSIKLDNPVNVLFLEEFIIKNKIGLIVVDTYRRLISFDENDAGAVSKLFVDYLKPVCDRTKVSFLILHHEKKGEPQGDEMDMLRGSSDLANYTDTILQVMRKGLNLTLKQTKQRGAKELEPFAIKLETDEQTYFNFVFAGQPETKENIVAQLLVDWLIRKKIKEFRYTDALDYVKSKGQSKNKLIEALEMLEAEGLITRGKGRKMPYSVAGDLSTLKLGDFNG